VLRRASVDDSSFSTAHTCLRPRPDRGHALRGRAENRHLELLNGDRITCELQRLERGKLTVKTDGLGTISIEWNDVARITSPSSFVVELDSASGISARWSPAPPARST
jgi:hypothetical protein